MGLARDPAWGKEKALASDQDRDPALGLAKETARGKVMGLLLVQETVKARVLVSPKENPSFCSTIHQSQKYPFGQPTIRHPRHHRPQWRQDRHW
jgi:hypothetical protein